MAVSKNPYEEWSDLRANADYRDRITQSFSLTRQQLSQAEYLLDENRVNPGPRRMARASLADSKQQTPHVLTNEDMWGWQRWSDEKYCLEESEVAPGLFENCEPNHPAP